MQSETGRVHECGPSAKCEFHGWGGSMAQPCSPIEGDTRYFTLDSKLDMGQAKHALEHWMIESALKRAKIDLPEGGSHSTAAAKLLGTTRQELERQLKKGRHTDLAHLWIRRPVGGVRLGAGRKKGK